MACFSFCLPWFGMQSPQLHSIRGAHAIVTGASEGLGIEMVHHLVSEGAAKIAIAARRKERLDQLAASVMQDYPNVEIFTIATDVSKVEDCEKLVKTVLDKFGRCDILVNNAGVPGVMHFDSAPAKRVDQVIDINLKGSIHLARCVVPHMMKAGRGHIVNIASLAGKGIEPYNSIYAASKYGVVGWSHALRAEMRIKKAGVTVHVICPGFITDVGMAAMPSKDLQIDSVLVEAMAAGGSSSPSDVAHAVVRAVKYDEPEIIVNSNYKPWRFAKNIGLNHLWPRREDSLTVSAANAPILAWLRTVADGQDKLG